MQLNQAQIQQLYAFTSKHFVEHYDLQTELVDHIANGIEQQLSENSDITFKQALNNEFRKFGVHGFEDVIVKRKRAMSLKYWKIIFGFFKDYFSFPKIIATLSAILFLGLVFWNIPLEIKENFFSGIGALIIVLWLFFMIRNKKQKKETKKRWMLKDQIDNIGNSFNLIHLIFFPIINSNLLGSVLRWQVFYIDVLLAFIIVTVVLISFIILKTIPQKAEELLTKTYPEYKLLQTL
ncbi:hypothetical protein [uncultured Maribacter sp.]|uniref:hypothetical protein n=1 Tax=uncultured Maribacter sp. TaxID=431308 RepID=UPI00262B9957|nr:hypothetical protein [uncultured Maribacter sp.]